MLKTKLLNKNSSNQEIDIKNNLQTFLKYYLLKIGPQHLLAHDALHLILDLCGQVIIKAGSLQHRPFWGAKKLIEFKIDTMPSPRSNNLVFKVERVTKFVFLIINFLFIENGIRVHQLNKNNDCASN